MRKVLSLILVLVVLSSGVMPVMANNTAKIKQSPALGKEELHKDVNIIKFDLVLENATPYWIIIAAGIMEQGRSAVFKYIDSSTNLTKAEKNSTEEVRERAVEKVSREEH
jgi:hypothetical protein